MKLYRGFLSLLLLFSACTGQRYGYIAKVKVPDKPAIAKAKQVKLLSITAIKPGVFSVNPTALAIPQVSAEELSLSKAQKKPNVRITLPKTSFKKPDAAFQNLKQVARQTTKEGKPRLSFNTWLLLFLLLTAAALTFVIIASLSGTDILFGAIIIAIGYIFLIYLFPMSEFQ